MLISLYRQGSPDIDIDLFVLMAIVPVIDAFLAVQDFILTTKNCHLNCTLKVNESRTPKKA